MDILDFIDMIGVHEGCFYGYVLLVFFFLVSLSSFLVGCNLFMS